MRDRSLQEPADILRGLNRRLIGRSEGGFTTCLLLHVTAGGEVTLANAGPRRLFPNPPGILDKLQLVSDLSLAIADLPGR
jgi:hypothetical protein